MIKVCDDVSATYIHLYFHFAQSKCFELSPKLSCVNTVKKINVFNFLKRKLIAARRGMNRKSECYNVNWTVIVNMPPFDSALSFQLTQCERVEETLTDWLL